MRIVALSGVIAVFLAVAGAATAGPLEAAMSAYQHGDYELAFRLFRPLANYGNARAQDDIGYLYDDGQGVPQDYAEGAKWHRLAADQGNANAQYNLGVAYSNGQGVSQNYGEAARWYRLAADQGNADARYNLGVAYSNGQGVSQDYEEAAKWYGLAADQGQADAQYNLGLMYGYGQGVPQNYVLAHMWVNLAALRFSAASEKLNEDTAVKSRGSFATRMMPAELAEAPCARMEADRQRQALHSLAYLKRSKRRGPPPADWSERPFGERQSNRCAPLRGADL